MNRNGLVSSPGVAPGGSQASGIQAAMPKTVVSDNPITNIGAVGDISLPNPQQTIRSIRPFTAQLTSASGAAKNFLMFDDTGLISAALGGTNADPDGITGNLTVAAIKGVVGRAPIFISGINYEITTGTSSQFAQSMKYVVAELDGSISTYPVSTSSILRNNRDVSTLLTIQFTNYMVLSWRSALFLTVADGVDVDITFIPAAGVGR